MALMGLASGLEALGHEITWFGPRRFRRNITVNRLVFNATLGRRLRHLKFDLVVGFDLDGCFYHVPPTQRYVVSLKGVLCGR